MSPPLTGASQPLVSIVTPSFRSGRFIERCIQSVLKQSYPRVEHILQDSASDDGTLEIFETYRGRVDWVSEPDRCQGDGLDRALKRCRGDIILVLNADDMLEPHAAAWAVENLARYPEAGVVYGDLLLVDGSDRAIGIYRPPCKYDYAKLVCVELVPPAQAAFIRRSALEQVGLGTDPRLRTCPDYEMWVRIGLHFPMRHVPGFVCKYRQHAGSGGCRPELIPQLVQDKKTVMDRLFDDPQTPQAVRALRRRAYVGLTLWAEQTRVEAERGRGLGTLGRASLAALRYPSARNLWSLVKMAGAWHYYRFKARRLDGNDAPTPWDEAR